VIRLHNGPTGINFRDSYSARIIAVMAERLIEALQRHAKINEDATITQ
jgi:hypothetical protein